MDFSWTPEQLELRAAAADLGSSINPDIADRDRSAVFDRDGWRRCGEFGIPGLPVPEGLGGLGLDALTSVGVLESLGYGCRDNGLVFALNAHLWTVAIPMLEFGTAEQKARYLPRLTSGKWIGGAAMTEPESGSDAYSLKSTARKDGDGYVLNGSKTFVTNGSIADVLLIYARTDESVGPHGIGAFIVETGTDGLKHGKPIAKMGLRTSPMSELFMTECRIPTENRLGGEGSGQAMFTSAMTWERGCILAAGVGSMQRLLETCIDYARQRTQFGQAIGKFQAVANRIVEMRLSVENARSFLYRTAWLRDQSRNVVLEAAMTKLVISEAWAKTAELAMQIFGGYGYMEEYEIERELRDAMASRIYSGTSDIQRNLIAAMLGL